MDRSRSFARMLGIACSSLLQRSAHARLRGRGSSDGRWGFEQQWTTAAAAEPMCESPVRYFTPEDCQLPERMQIAPVDSAEAWRGTEGRATLPPLTSAQSPVARADDDSHTVLSATRAASAQSARALSDDTQKGDAERPAGSLSRCRLFRPRHHHDDPPGAGNFGGALVCAWGRQGPVRRFRRFQVA